MLQAGGHCQGRVTSVDVAELGVGRGYISNTVRLTPTYEQSEPSAPVTIIAKVPTFVVWPDFFLPLISTWVKAEIDWYREASSDCPAHRKARALRRVRSTR